MKEIPLTRGYVAIVDDAEYAAVVAAGPWHVQICRRNKYAANSKGRYLHAFILAITDPSVEIDHENDDGLDNRRKNLRVARHQQNIWHSRGSGKGASQYKGVARRENLWRAYIVVDGKQKPLGLLAPKWMLPLPMTRRPEGTSASSQPATSL